MRQVAAAVDPSGSSGESGGSSGTAQTVPAAFMPFVDVPRYQGVQSELTGYTFTQVAYAGRDPVQGPRAVAHAASAVAEEQAAIELAPNLSQARWGCYILRKLFHSASARSGLRALFPNFH